MKLLSRDSKALLAAFLCALWAFFPSSARAQIDVVEVTPLYFGQIAIRDYNLVGRVTIRPNGTYTINGNVYLHNTPTRGEYLLQTPNNNMIYTITFPPSVNLTGPGGNFTLDTLDSRPNVLITNGIGEDTFFISGRLRTLGGGTFYGDGTYTNTFTVDINF